MPNKMSTTRNQHNFSHVPTSIDSLTEYIIYFSRNIKAVTNRLLVIVCSLIFNCFVQYTIISITALLSFLYT